MSRLDTQTMIEHIESCLKGKKRVMVFNISDTINPNHVIKILENKGYMTSGTHKKLTVRVREKTE